MCWAKVYAYELTCIHVFFRWRRFSCKCVVVIHFHAYGGMVNAREAHSKQDVVIGSHRQNSRHGAEVGVSCSAYPPLVRASCFDNCLLF